MIDINTGDPLGPGEQGEICVRGPQIVEGYLNRPDATKEAFDSSGWFHTGKQQTSGSRFYSEKTMPPIF